MDSNKYPAKVVGKCWGLKSGDWESRTVIVSFVQTPKIKYKDLGFNLREPKPRGMVGGAQLRFLNEADAQAFSKKYYNSYYEPYKSKEVLKLIQTDDPTCYIQEDYVRHELNYYADKVPQTVADNFNSTAPFVQNPFISDNELKADADKAKYKENRRKFIVDHFRENLSKYMSDWSIIDERYIKSNDSENFILHKKIQKDTHLFIDFEVDLTSVPRAFYTQANFFAAINLKKCNPIVIDAEPFLNVVKKAVANIPASTWDDVLGTSQYSYGGTGDIFDIASKSYWVLNDTLEGKIQEILDKDSDKKNYSIYKYDAYDSRLIHSNTNNISKVDERFDLQIKEIVDALKDFADYREKRILALMDKIERMLDFVPLFQ